MIKKISYCVFLTFLVGCKSVYTVTEFQQKEIPTAPNYENEINWAVLPNTYSEGLKEFASKETDTLKADVFYVYPTLNTEEEDVRWNVPITDLVQQNKVLNKVVLFQASAFTTAGKLYVPYYRQAHLRSYSELAKGGKRALLLAYSDVKKSI